MPHVSPLSRSDLPEYEFLFEGAEKALGTIPNSMLTMGHKPAVLGGFALLNAAIFHRFGRPTLKSLRFLFAFLKAARKRDPENEIPGDLAELIAHVCSLAAGCRYCQAHTATAAALHNVANDKIEALPHYDTSDHFSDAERAALRLAFAAAQVPNAAAKAHFDDLRKHYNEKQIIEIVAIIAMFGFLNRWNDTMATALEEGPHTFAQEHLAKHGWDIGKHAATG